MEPISAEKLANTLALAVKAHREGNLRQASTGYKKVLQAEPDHVTTTQLLGALMLQSNQLQSARELLTKAITLDATHGPTFHNLARLDEAEGNLVQAESHYTQAYELAPDNADTSYSLANVLMALGRFEESEHWFRKTLSISPTYASAHRQIARLRRQNSVNDDVLAMQAMYDDPGTKNSAKVHLAFGLGKAYEDMKAFDVAFEYYAAANRFKREELRFDIKAWAKEVDKIVNTFTVELFKKFEGSGSTSAGPIFILGMPRSGTSLIEQILASHSSVYGAGELQALNLAIMSAMNVAKFPFNVPELQAQAIENMSNHYLAHTSVLDEDASFITDKKPDNFKLIGMIKLMFPNAIVIHSSRDPIDNCLSLFKNHFSDNGPFYSYEQSELGEYYRGYARLMAHWHEVLPGFLHDVSYEHLVSDTEAAIRQLLEQCNLDFEPACLEFQRTTRSVRTASAVQVRQSIYSTSVELWRRYEAQLAPLIKALEQA